MRPFVQAIAVLALTVTPAFAGAPDSKTEKVVTVEETPFDKGKLELQSNTGAYFSFGSDRPTINYTNSSYRLGVMLNTPEGDGFFRGNVELLLEASYSSVFDDNPGNYIGGGAIVIRYNFVQPGAKWVPYVQISGGAVYNDIYKDRSQRLIGQAWEIQAGAAIGVRYMFSDRWSANIEGGYRHISNAGMDDRNVGLNSLGGGIGLSRHF